MAETSKATIPVFHSPDTTWQHWERFSSFCPVRRWLCFIPRRHSAAVRVGDLIDSRGCRQQLPRGWPVATVMGLMRLRTTWLEARYLTRSFELQRQTQVLDLAMTVTNYSASSPVSAEIGATINSAWPSPGGSTQWVLAPVIPALGKKDRQ